MSAETPDWRSAFNRFGYGARPGDGARQGDPREALLAEISGPESTRLDDPALRSTPQILVDVYADNLRKKMEREAVDAGRMSTKSMPEPNVAALIFPSVPAPMSGANSIRFVGAHDMPMTAKEIPPEQQAFRADARARLLRAYSASIGFGERLVAFWSNHFCVSVAKSDIGRASAGAFEREAIRPHVLGRFADMLKAVEQHPAMLNFLDNAQSIGPNSIAGHNNKSGLNENLAREILELHTMGVGSGYSQADVTQLAYIITGWTIVGREGKLGEPGSFAFDPNRHEPLAAVVRGRLYLQDGVAQGEAALDDIAREPATAKHISHKLVRHFVADEPDPGLVQRLAAIFLDTDGDLAAVSRALATDPVAWRAPASKIRNPWELTVAAHRAFQHDPNDPGPAVNALNLLGMPLWQPAGPNGFSDDSAAWTSPEGVKTRLELAMQFARQARTDIPPLELLHDVLGPRVSLPTREAITRAESAEQAYALLILSPEFQRR